MFLSLRLISIVGVKLFFRVFIEINNYIILYISIHKYIYLFHINKAYEEYWTNSFKYPHKYGVYI